MVQFFQLQAALHVIPGKCSTRYSAWGAAKLSIGCVWLSCLIFHFGKCIYGLQTGLLLRITLFIPFLAQTVDIWTWLYLLCLLYACYFKCSTKNAARGAAKLSIGCVWLSCLNFSFWKVHLLTSFIPFLAQTVDIWTWLYLLCLLYACYFNLQTYNGIVSICFIREPSWTTF